jgi:hypothetical protein
MAAAALCPGRHIDAEELATTGELRRYKTVLQAVNGRPMFLKS